MAQIFKLGAILLALLFVSALRDGAGRAASRLTEDLTEMLRTADAVVQVTVTAVHVQAESADSLPFTVVTLNVEKVYKGALVAGTEIKAEYLGGMIDGLKVNSPGLPQLNVGDRVVLLLAQVPGAKNWRVLGGDAGQIMLSRDESGKDVARRSSGRFEFYVSDEASLTGYRSIKATTVYADQLGVLLQTVLETGRPVLETKSVASAMVLPPAPMAAITTTPESNEASASSRIFVVLIGTTMVWAASRYFRKRRAATAGYRARIS